MTAPAPATARYDVSLLDDTVLHLFREGELDHAHRSLGAHITTAADGTRGTCFAVWAPNAASVALVGDFNNWSRTAHPMRLHGSSGIWEVFVPGVGHGAHYKYHIAGRTGRYRVDKADPYGVYSEVPPDMASIVWDMAYTWNDGEWMSSRGARHVTEQPMAIYEVHLGSWRRVTDEDNRPLTYREIAAPLAEYVTRMGFTHVELMPVMEHPYYASWGYQLTGFFAATSRYGTPQDLMYLIDVLHQHKIGVILDWVPSHFPTDAHGLSYFDGTHLYEHADPRQGFHPDWGSNVFNYARHEVANFLRSNAIFWLELYHADGLRVDAVASMLHLDFSRKEGEWIPNRYGGNENLDAVEFLRRLNEGVYRDHPDVVTIAEDSTAWPMVSRPAYLGGLGFGMKWDMGWMHDSLAYFKQDPVHRAYHHQKVTFRMMYAFAENYVLALSHDEVVHLKGSLLTKMSGDAWKKRANLRLLLAWMYGQPGKKLLFMGGEFGQIGEWSHDRSLDWHLLDDPGHAGLQRWTSALNFLYRDTPALHEQDTKPSGFEWIDCSDALQSVVSFLRFGDDREEPILVVYNFTPVPRPAYRIGIPDGGTWEVLLNSDDVSYGGSGWSASLRYESQPAEDRVHGREYAAVMDLPPLGALFLRRVPGTRPVRKTTPESDPVLPSPPDIDPALESTADNDAALGLPPDIGDPLNPRESGGPPPTDQPTPRVRQHPSNHP